MFFLEPVEPAIRPGAGEFRLRLIGQIQEVAQVCLAGSGLRFGSFRKFLGGVLVKQRVQVVTTSQA